MAVGLLAASVLAAGPAYAAWSDAATATSRSLVAHTVAEPASVACSGGGLAASLTYSWPHRDVRYSYTVTLERPAGTPLQERTVAGSGAQGSTQSTTWTAAEIGGLVAVGATFTIRVRSFVAAAPAWTSAGSVTSTGTYTSVVGVGLFTSC